MNPFDLMKQFGNMQQRMNEVQEKLKDVTATGTAGGDMVQVEINGQMEIQNVQISREAVDPDDLGLLEDLIQAACADALVKIKDSIRDEVSSLTGGMQLPPGFLGT